MVKERCIRIILALVAQLDLELDQLDVKTTFLHEGLDEVIYMRQPEGFEQGDKVEKVCLLKKFLYGLKQSSHIDEFMIKQRFTPSEYDWCVYSKELENKIHTYLLLHVDDILIVCQDINMLMR